MYLASLRKLACALALATPALGGCATLFNGTSDSVHIESSPSAARYAITSAGGGITATKDVTVASGTTPATVNLSKKSAYVLTVKLEGYQESKVPIDQDFNGWIILSALCGILPAGIDVLTGGMWDLTPEQIHVELRRLGPAPAPGAPPAPAAPATGEPPSSVRLDGEPAPAGASNLYLFVYRRGPDGETRYLSQPLVPEAA
ncbi:MAG TPA: hypothetical protein VFS43_20185 [Polyangiaceae bacterium]|nr:hypothetical protein [Polyangiaceae bacterium]